MEANFIREGVLATAVVIVKLNGTILFQSPFPTSSSHYVVSRVASDIAPCMLFHPTPNTENDEDYRNDSDSVLRSAVSPSGRALGSHDKCLSTEIPKHVSEIRKTSNGGILGMRKSYAIGNPISNPYFDAIFGINNRGRVLGSTVYRTTRGQHFSIRIQWAFKARFW